MGIANFSISTALIKDTVAAHLRDQIIAGHLAPGEPLIEGKWASKLNVAQSSIRAALNILESEGFVERRSGRSAHVTQITQADIPHSFQVRAILEALVARLVAQRQPDLSELDQVIADMRSAVACSNLQAFYERAALPSDFVRTFRESGPGADVAAAAAAAIRLCHHADA